MAESSALPGYETTYYNSKIQTCEDGGVTKYIEEGMVRVIDSDIQTSKYLALHRSLRIGTIFQVINLMTNESTYVRVVGKLPDTGINKNVMIRLTDSAYKRLGIIDEKSLVEIVYFD